VLWRLPNYFEPSRGIGHPPRETQKDEIEFDDKIPKVFWRGGVSGSHWITPFKKLSTPWLSSENFNDVEVQSKFSRVKLVSHYSNSSVIDAKFSGGTVDRFIDPSIQHESITSPAVHTSEMMKYKYLLCPAG